MKQYKRQVPFNDDTGLNFCNICIVCFFMESVFKLCDTVREVNYIEQNVSCSV